MDALDGIPSVSSRDAGWCGYRTKRTGGSSGYDHPSPSIPLPVEGRGKSRATRPGILGALAASVTGCKNRHLHNGFLKSFKLQVCSKSLDSGCGKLRWLDANSGAHGVTRPTTRGSAAMHGVIGVRFQSVKSDISGGFHKL